MTPTLIWLDMLAGSRDTEPPPILKRDFMIRQMTYVNATVESVRRHDPDCIVFDFDYPDRRRLELFESVKAAMPSVPVVAQTLQHSESLAVWAFRCGAMDYLVKPVPMQEWQECKKRLLTAHGLRRSQGRRTSEARKSPIPATIPNRKKTVEEKLAPAVNFVQQNYRSKIYTDGVARLCGMSPSGFSRAFKSSFDMTFQDFLVRFRIDKACCLLDSGESNVSAVSYTVGFSDPSYFSRMFKRCTGLPPSEYSAARNRTSRLQPLPPALSDASSTVIVPARIGRAM